jgi:hypothetical protein
MALSFGYALEEDKLSTPPKMGERMALNEVAHCDKWQVIFGFEITIDIVS